MAQEFYVQITLADGTNASVPLSQFLDAAFPAGANAATDQVLKYDGANVVWGAAPIPDNSVTSAKIVDGTIVTADLADNSVTTAKIVDANVTAGKIAADAVTTAKILDANVTTAKIADLNVTSGKLAANAVTAGKIAAGTIVNADISAAAAIATSKLADAAQIVLASQIVASSWVPTLGAGGAMTYTSTNVTYARYFALNKLVILFLSFNGTLGGSASTSITFTLPPGLNSNQGAGALIGGGYGIGILNGSSWAVMQGASIVEVYKDDFSNYALGAGIGHKLVCVYEAA